MERTTHPRYLCCVLLVTGSTGVKGVLSFALRTHLAANLEHDVPKVGKDPIGCVARRCQGLVAGSNDGVAARKAPKARMRRRERKRSGERRGVRGKTAGIARGHTRQPGLVWQACQSSLSSLVRRTAPAPPTATSLTTLASGRAPRPPSHSPQSSTVGCWSYAGGYRTDSSARLPNRRTASVPKNRRRKSSPGNRDTI